MKHWTIWRGSAYPTRDAGDSAVATEFFGTKQDVDAYLSALANHPAAGRFIYWIA